MAAPRRVVDLAIGADELSQLEAIARSRTQPASRVERARILLAYCEGWSREELAQRFDRPVNTVKTWLHRGLASLRTCLDAQ